MRRRVVITGAGLVSSLGDSLAGLHAALCEGVSGIQPVEMFGTADAGCKVGGEIKGFDAGKYLGQRNLRPLDRTSRLVASAAQLALDDSVWSAEMRAEREVGLVLGTMFCSVHTISEFDRRAQAAGPAYASPMDFANTVINAAAGQTAILHNLRGVNTTISTGMTSGLQAIGYATELIRNGRACAVLAGGAEELCFESYYGFDRARMLCKSDLGAGCFPVPFDARRNGFALGEGAALLMLEDEETAAQRGARVLGEIRGVGSAFDCAQDLEAEGSVEAIANSIQFALDDAELTATEVDCLSASANGSVKGDRDEARAVAAVFDGLERRLPVTAIKSMLGETLGASGALQVTALLGAMSDGVLPGIRRLEEVEKDFPLELAGRDRREIALGVGLVNSVGHDGQCCSLLVARRER